jgi:putative sigma-54 modulation protein
VQVTVSARHGQLDDDTQRDLRERAEKLAHFFDRLTSVVVTVDLHPDRDHSVAVEILAHAEHKHEFVAADRGADPGRAFAAAADRIRQQIKHHKEKLQDHRRDPSHNGGA